MRVVILAAGEGVRMRPLTLATPKPLLKIQGKAVIDYIFEALPDEVDEAIVVVKYLADKIKEYLGDNHKGRRIRYVEGSEKGNAIGFLNCSSYIPEGDRFLVLHGDEPQRRSEIEECLRYPYAWVCSEVPESHTGGFATIDGQNRILDIVEEPSGRKTKWSAMGTILVDTSIFGYEPIRHVNGEYPLALILSQFVKDHPVHAVYGKRRPPLRSLKDLEWDMKDFLD